jgi:hypothetical protein
MTQTMSPGIAHYIPSQKGALKTVAWQTRSGETKSVTGRITGWALDQGGRQYLKIRDGEHKVRSIPAAAIERHLDATGQTRRDEVRIPRCLACGKILGAGSLGHMDEFSGLEGYCYDCV